MGLARSVWVAVVLVLLASVAQADRRVALVIGVGDYASLRPLANPLNDADAVAGMLRTLGFDVALETDRDLRRLRRALENFAEDARGAEVALVYFAGHGVEMGGENLLLPVDADPSSPEAFRSTSLPLDEVARIVGEAARVGLILIDACRTDPFGVAPPGMDPAEASRAGVALQPQGFPRVSPGLARMGRAEGLLYAFAAAPGEPALDGDAGANSPFAGALIRYLGTEGVEVRSALTLVQQEVYDRTRGRQLPYVESGLPTLFFAAAAPEGGLPERERLLLAMANLTPDLRAEIEATAASRDMPLAPLYAALLSADLAGLSPADRERALAEAADAFLQVRAEMSILASSDPEVASLRRQAEDQLELGAFEAARALLRKAVEIDEAARDALRTNYTDRTLSAAASLELSAGAARAELRYELAIADYARAAELYGEVEGPELPTDARFRYSSILWNLGDLYATVGRTDDALATYSVWNAVALARVREAPDDADWLRDLSVSHNKVGDARIDKGDLPGALSAYSAGLAIAVRLSALDPGNVIWQRDLMIGYNKVGDVRVTQGDLPGALESFTAGLRIAELLVRFNPSDLDWQRDLMISHNRIGDVQRVQGDPAGAMANYAAGLGIARYLVALDPDNFLWQRDLRLSWEKIANVLLGLRDFQGALAAATAAQDIARMMTGRDPGNIVYQIDFGVTHNLVGDVRLAMGDLDGALEQYVTGRAIAEAVAARDPGNALRQRGLSVAYERIGDVLREKGEPVEALAAYQSAREIVERLTRLDPRNTEWQRGLMLLDQRIGDSLQNLGDAAAALAAHSAALETSGRLVALDPGNILWQFDRVVALERVGDQLNAQGDAAASLAFYVEQIAILNRILRLDPRHVEAMRSLGLAQQRVAGVQALLGDIASARVAWTAAVEAAQRLVAVEPARLRWQLDLAASQVGLGDLEAGAGEHAAAVPAYRGWIETLTAVVALAPHEPVWQHDLLIAGIRLAESLIALGRKPEALEALQAAVAVGEGLAVLDPTNPNWNWDLFVAYWNLADAGGDRAAAFRRGIELLETLDRAGQLLPDNRVWIDEMRTLLAEAQGQ